MPLSLLGDESGQLEAPANSLKVGGNTDVRELANSVVRACAAGDPPALLTIGNQVGPSVLSVISLVTCERCACMDAWISQHVIGYVSSSFVCICASIGVFLRDFFLGLGVLSFGLPWEGLPFGVPFGCC
eukprot:1157244-Pelagomonas_calceolata.AAC.5